MYRFSRSIYRELAPRVSEPGQGGTESRRHVLEACEATVERIVRDGRYFSRPAKSLFGEVREHFPISQQADVYRVIQRNIDLATSCLERMPSELGLDAVTRHCRASTRRGTPCRREPLPGRDYCPSHKHLEEPVEEPTKASAVAA